MNNRIIRNTFIAIIIFIIGLIYLSKNTTLFQDNKDTLFEKKQACSQYNDLAKQKIEESGRVFQSKGEYYKLNEIFYSSKMDTCLYAYTIYTGGGGAIYSIYDLFGANVFDGTIDTEFYNKRVQLK